MAEKEMISRQDKCLSFVEHVILIVGSLVTVIILILTVAVAFTAFCSAGPKLCPKWNTSYGSHSTTSHHHLYHIQAT